MKVPIYLLSPEILPVNKHHCSYCIYKHNKTCFVFTLRRWVIFMTHFYFNVLEYLYAFESKLAKEQRLSSYWIVTIWFQQNLPQDYGFDIKWLFRMGFSSIGPGLDRLAVPLIHLTGLDVRQNAIHKCIHDTFRSRKGFSEIFPIQNLQISTSLTSKNETLKVKVPQ